MKKLLILTAVCAVGALTTNCAFADACSDRGLTTMKSCDSSTRDKNGSAIWVDPGCGGTTLCLLRDCDGVCMCVSPSCPTSKTCPSTCPSTEWSAGNTGYEKRCNSSYQCEYRCAAGYYGSTLNGTSGCTVCPVVMGGRTSDPGSNRLITDCYIPSGTSFSDTTGSGTYTSDCHYSN